MNTDFNAYTLATTTFNGKTYNIWKFDNPLTAGSTTFQLSITY